MSALYDRRWRVTIGTLQSTELDISFKITRTLRPVPGTCEVVLYNLTESHRTQAQALRRALVRVEAGYADSMPMLFQGDSRRVTIERDKADWVTKITAGDGEYAIRTARVARSFGPDTRLEEVIRALASGMGVGTGNVGEQLRARSLDRVSDLFPRGTAVRGACATELTELLRSASLEWSVQDGVLQVLPRGQALARTAVRLASETGMVGSPARGQHGVVKVKSLLNADLVPGRQVQLDALVIHGLYRIQKATYEGNTRSNDWYADLELRQVTG